MLRGRLKVRAQSNAENKEGPAESRDATPCAITRQPTAGAQIFEFDRRRTIPPFFRNYNVLCERTQVTQVTSDEITVFRADFSGIRGSAAEAVVDGFPLGRVGREVDGDPVVFSGIGLVENFVERGGVVWGGFRHLDRLDSFPRRPMLVLEIDSLALVWQFPV